MSVIQKIRDKYARWAVVAIALSLLGFILMDAFAGRTGMFSNRPSNTLAKVNGSTIDRKDFEEKIKATEARAIANGYTIGDVERQQIQQSLYDEEVNSIILNEQYEKLGLTVTDKEMRDVLYGNNPPEFLKQAFTDSVGKYNGNMAQQEVNKLLKSGTIDQKKFINDQMEDTKKQRLLSKYMALMTNSIYFPKWFVEKRNVDNSLIGKISFARVGYETINDSTIKVSDDEIKDYINKHKSAFEQKEETRTISYVIFNASASSADSAEARNGLLALKPGFDSAKNAGQYADANNTAFPFLDSYVTKTAMQQPNKDSITGTPVGVVYGPYLDASGQSGKGFYVMSKVISTKTLPDSVTARHILVATAQRTEQGMVPVRDDSTAKHLIDSYSRTMEKRTEF